MSLTDLEHQIETAALLSTKLEDDDKISNKGGFSSRVRSGIRKEFSAFRKVLENSKSRLQELKEMQDTLEALEEPVLTPTGNKSKKPFKRVTSTAKSPHWLPALGRKKKFFRDDEDEEGRDENTGRAKLAAMEDRQDDAEPSSGQDDSEEHREEASSQTKQASKDAPPQNKESSPPREAPTNVSDQQIEKPIVPEKPIVLDKNPISPKTSDWNLAVESIQNEFTIDESDSGMSSPEGDDAVEDPGEGPSLSLATREQSFRINLQARAVAMSKKHQSFTSHRSTKSKSTVRSKTEGSDSDNDETESGQTISNGGSSSSGESLTAFAKRLEKSIRMMTTAELLASVESSEEPDEQEVGTPLDDVLEEPAAESTEEPPTVEPQKEIPAPLIKKAPSSPEEEKPTKEPKINKPALLFRKVSSLSLRRLKFPKTSSRKKNEERKVEPPQPIAEAPEHAVPVGDKQSDDIPSPLPALDNSLQQGERNQALISKSPMAREKSFHTDGWKGVSVLPAEALTEEAIATNELQARESYIKQMHSHQMLLKSGKDEKSHEVFLSQKRLQASFQRIEYWEILKEKFNSNRAAFSPPLESERSVSLPDEDDLGVGHISSFGPQDSCYVGEQELKAREAYINSMRQHQELVGARVKHNSAAWIASQKKQQQCLAKLQYWESKNEECEEVLETIRENGNRPERVQVGASKSIYKVSLENKQDRQGSESLIESLAKSVQAKLSSSKKTTNQRSPGELPDGVLSSNESDLSQMDDGGIASAFENLCAIVLPFCVDSGCHQRQDSTASNIAKETTSATAKKRQKKAVADRRASDTPRGSRKVKAHADASASTTTANPPVKKISITRTASSRNKAMNAIESEAKQILGYLSVGMSADSYGAPEALSGISPNKAGAGKTCVQATFVRVREASKDEVEEVKIPESTPHAPAQRHRSSDEGDESSGEVSKHIDEGAPLFCS